MCDAKLVNSPGRCSDDIMEVWHGMSTPAKACGKHSARLGAVFAGHRVRDSR